MFHIAKAKRYSWPEPKPYLQDLQPMMFLDFDFFVLIQDINIFPYSYIWPECETYFLPVSFLLPYWWQFS